jgi:molybdopterin synthase catalytic subunit
MAVFARLEPQSLDPSAELARFIEGRGRDGAVVSFTGLVRAEDREGRPLTRLHLDWYPGMTEASIAAIAEDAATRFAVSDVLVVHRCGDISPGAPIVFAAAAASHRRDAFLACDFLMDRLKTDAAFWKREDGEGGSRWIEPTDTDRADAARWSD